ncbi:WD40-repeat-containing domain protein [Zopfochytrium polystomum]|nr:WD40-repeat-containing domain protein [Zopfochytrium polystomum]
MDIPSAASSSALEASPDPRATKLHDLVSHTAPATCLHISQKSGRVLASGSEDRKVHLWTIGNPNPALTLTGLPTTVESVTIDWPEEIVVAGGSNGMVKLWDLENAKVIRTLTGHKGPVTTVEFHPFGEFFASGSADAAVKIWDVRKKGCIHTYAEHEGTVDSLKISPDGRWIATGSRDGRVKIWDMTAGKLLATPLDEPGVQVAKVIFNPVEFMLASISSDQRIRFYDLETFSLISASEPIGSNPGSLQFHTEGRHIFVSSTKGLQVWSSEPTLFQDQVNVNWDGISDMKVLENGKLIAASKHQTIISVWGVHYEKLAPFGARPGSISRLEPDRPLLPQISGANPMDRARSLQQTEAFDPSTQVQAYQQSSTSQIFKRGFGDEKASADAPSSYIPPSKEPPNRREKKQGSATPWLKDGSDDATASSTSDVELLENAEKGHMQLLASLRQRLDAIRAARPSFFQPRNLSAASMFEDGVSPEGNLRACVETLVAMSPPVGPSVWVDLLRVWNLKPTLFSLDVAAMLLPELNEILFSIHEDHIIAACTTIRILARSFGTIITDALRSSKLGASGLDFAREEREQRSLASLQGFRDVQMTLTDLRRSPGRVGATVKDTLHELQGILT